MLVVISDLHLTDGTSGSTISAGAFQLLAERLADLAASASARADGSYRPIEQIDLVLLGDVLDVIRSTRWLEDDARPWDDPASPQLAERVGAITTEILRRNEASLGMLRSLSQGSIRLTPATQMGRLANTAESVPVPVRIHYVVGNHDWPLHLPGAAYDRIRRQVAVHMGLATAPELPFPHEPWESNELLQALRRHKVFARHGDVFDPINFEGIRDASSLGDVIVVELVNRFGVEVERRLSHELPVVTAVGLRELDNIRPLVLIPVWIDGLLERTVPSSELRRRVKQIWDDLADEFLALPFVRERDSWRPRDLVDGLQRAIKFSRRMPINWASSVAQWLCGMRGADTASFSVHALGEPEFRNRRAKYIVYGHTHTREEVPLDCSYAEGYVLNQVYFNSGTWRRVFQQTCLAAREHEFISHDTLSFVTFFQGDERRGRPYETWTGTLGISPNQPQTHRVDPAATAQAAPLPTLDVPVGPRGPHFSMAPTIATTFTTASDA